jgi:hypothetical protein
LGARSVYDLNAAGCECVQAEGVMELALGVVELGEGGFDAGATPASPTGG